MTESTPRRGNVLLLVGTRKGAFLFWSDPGRERWQRSVHHLGWEVDHFAYDRRDGTVFATTTSPVFASLVQRSRDLGATWEHLNRGLEFPAGSDHRVARVWHVEPGPPERPGRVYAGVEHAGLFVSDDGGEQWTPVTALNDHHTNDRWEPGGGGLMVHTILNDPADGERIYIGISAGGCYRSDDGGTSWAPKNSGVRADFLAETYPEVGQCVHKMAIHPDRPEVVYQQNHCGVYRSDNRGEHWVDISDGLPSRFGFPLALHGDEPDTAYVIPLHGDDRRVVPDGKLIVWRTRDRGESWEPLTSGLPERAYVSVLREGLATDDAAPGGVYFGTTTGQLYGSRDGGNSWTMIADLLPPIYSVEAAIVV